MHSTFNFLLSVSELLLISLILMTPALVPTYVVVALKVF